MTAEMVRVPGYVPVIPGWYVTWTVHEPMATSWVAPETQSLPLGATMAKLPLSSDSVIALELDWPVFVMVTVCGALV